MLHAEPGMVGTESREVLQDNLGRVEMHGRIMEFHPGASMAVLLEGQGMTVTARYEVSPHPAGTLLHVEQSLAVPGRVARLLEPLIRRRVATRARADLQRLKHLCESGLPQAPPTSRPGDSAAYPNGGSTALRAARRSRSTPAHASIQSTAGCVTSPRKALSEARPRPGVAASGMATAGLPRRWRVCRCRPQDALSN